MISYEWRTFPNVGYIQTKFTDEQLSPLLQEIRTIESDFDAHHQKRYNEKLAGNIRHEYELETSKEHLSKLILPYVDEFEKEFEYLYDTMPTTKEVPLVLSECWVNFQSKYEFNPTHYHGGLLSFVIFIQIPYEFENENAFSPGAYSPNPSAGMFEFSYCDTIAGMKLFTIPVDKSMLNTMILFPSKLNHQVYPFFSSDNFRITVSGNIKLDIK